MTAEDPVDFILKALINSSKCEIGLTFEAILKSLRQDKLYWLEDQR